MACSAQGMRCGHAGVFDLLHDRAGFLFVVAKVCRMILSPSPLSRPELFAAAAGVVFDDGVGGVQNRVRGAIILLELDDFDLGKMLFQVEQVGDFRAAPAVNALVIIADDAEIAMLLGQRVDEIELRGVGVLVFVHHHIAIFARGRLPGRRDVP